jgi:hypothetical protein
VALGMMLKLLLDTRQQVKYKDFDELRYIMAGALFFTSLVFVLLPAEVNARLMDVLYVGARRCRPLTSDGVMQCVRRCWALSTLDVRWRHAMYFFFLKDWWHCTPASDAAELSSSTISIRLTVK